MMIFTLKKIRRPLRLKKKRFDPLSETSIPGGLSAEEIKSSVSEKNESLRLLGLTIGISMVLHLIVFTGFSHVQMFESHIVTDLAFHDLSEPPSRSIPRPPRPASKELSGLDDIKDIRNYKASSGNPIPPAESAKPVGSGHQLGGSIAGISGIAAGSEGSISIPAVPGIAVGNYGQSISQWHPKNVGDMTAAANYSTFRTYLDIVKLKIEKNKKYPEFAKRTQLEGTVTLKFIITLNGDVKNTEIAKSSRHPVLDEAAMEALKDAAPFPKPPAQLFKEEIPLQVSIVFQLT